MAHLGLHSSGASAPPQTPPAIPKLKSGGKLKKDTSSRFSVNDTERSQQSNIDYEQIDDSVFRKYSLRFKDPELEIEYDKFLIARFLKQQKITLMATAFCFFVQATLDPIYYIFVHHYSVMYMGWQYSTFGACALGAIALCFKRLHPYAQYITCFCLFVGAAIPEMTSGIVYYFYFGDLVGGTAAFVIVVIGTCSRVKFFYTLVSCVLMLLYYVFMVFLWFSPGGPTLDSEYSYRWFEKLVSPFTLIGVCIISVYPCMYMEKLTRRSFLNAHILQLEEQKLSWAKKRDEALLHNIFPVELTDKLKDLATQAKEKELAKGNLNTPRLLICEEYPSVTVLMADIVGFTSLSSRVTAKELVGILNTVFSVFDSIAKDANMEKIRTLGDAYLCVANMTTPVTNHQERTLQVAQRMLETLPQFRKMFPTEPPLSLRIGIGSGPVIAGIMGSTKWNYDIMGDTVNETFLLEAASKPGRITVNGNVIKALPKGKYMYEDVVPAPLDLKGNPIPAYSIVYDFEQKAPYQPANTLNGVPEAEHTRAGTARPRTGKADSFEKKRKMDNNALFAMSLQPHIPDNEDFVDDGPYKALLSSPYYTGTIRKLMKEPVKVSKKLQFSDLADDNDELRLRQKLLLTETISFEKRVFWMKFKSNVLEREYINEVAQNTQSFTANITIAWIICQIFWIITDTVFPDYGYVYASDIPKAMWFFDGASILACLLLVLFAKSKYFLHPISVWVTGFLVTATAFLSPMASYYISENADTAYRIVYASFVVFNYTRLPQYYILLIGTAVSAMGTAFGAPALGIYVWDVVIVHIMGLIMSYASYIILEKAMRTDFLMARTIECKLAHMQVTTWRAKLLLYNILPRSIAKQLTESETIVDFFANATICFAYLNVGKLAFRPREMFSVLNDLFTLFDELAKENGCEKIKTINTTYMMVSGVPNVRSDHCLVALKQMKQMFDAVRLYRCPHIDPDTGKPYTITLRAGMACGPVVAGVIGKSKYAYDIWSDSTNTASRMESTGLESHIQATEDVYMACRSQYAFKERGTVFVKGKGEMNTFLLATE